MQKDARRVFAKNLNSFIEARGVSQLELAIALNKPASTVSDWCTGKSYPRVDSMQQIADFFSVLMSDLTTDQNNFSSYKNVVELPSTKKIPFFPYGIACGSPIEAREDEYELIDIPSYIMADFAVLCKGDSMLGAHIRDGSVVYIKSQPFVENGKVAAVLIDGEATLKKVYWSGRTLILAPANPDFQPLVYSGSELENIRILGPAVAYTSKMV